MSDSGDRPSEMANGRSPDETAGSHEEERAEPSSTFGRILSNYSQRVSRRGFIDKAALTLLGAIGGRVLVQGTAYANPPASLVGGGGYNSADWHHCTSWDRCKMCGYSCNCCNDDGDNPGRCPDCAARADSWDGCCRNDSGVLKMVRYVDCRKNNCGTTKLNQCYDCSGCNNACDHQVHSRFWKTASQTYLCTTVNVVGDC